MGFLKIKTEVIRGNNKMRIAIFVFVAIFLIPPTAFAQEPSGEVLKQLEKKETLPKPEEPAKAPVIQQQEKPAPTAAAGPKIFVKTFKIQGATILDEAALNTIIAPYQNKELTLSEIIQAADAITTAYRQKGFLTANAFVPVQDIKDGVVVIQVIEGKTGAITITGNKNYKTEFIQKHLEKIKQDPSLKEQSLERALLLLNDYLSLNINASLKAGTEPGTTDIAITAKDSYPISASLTYDNFGTDTLSKNRMSLSIDKGSTITDGDLIRLSGVTGLDRIDLNKLSYGRIEYILPLDYNGTRAGIYYANSLYEAGKEFASLIIKGKANIAGLYITNPIIKTVDTTLSIKLAFDYKNINDYMLDSLRSGDNIRAGSLGITLDAIDNLYLSARNILSLTYSRGMGTILGGTGKNDPKASRVNADGEFNKYTLDAVRVQKLPGYTHLLLKGAGQYSSDPLFIAEQYSIGGVGSVRGFKPSSQSGDSGYNLTGELLLSPFFPETAILNQKIGDTIKLALFADHGGVYRNNVQPGENKDDYLTGIGAGIRIFYGKNFSARFDYAVPEIKGKFNGKNSEIYLQATVSF